MSSPDPLKRLLHGLLQAQMPSKEEASDLLRPISATFAAHGIEQLTAFYSGSGDEGAIEEIDVEPEEKTLPEDLRELVEAWILAVLPRGWEINEGSEGCVVITPAESKAEIEHGERSVEYQTFEIG